jgi:hypothetical protein
MIKHALLTVIALLLFLTGCRNESPEIISFYSVPLVCGAAPEIGCGSRIKPFFIALEKVAGVKETWTNREGTIIGISWQSEVEKNKAEQLFKDHDIEAKLISDKKQLDSLTQSLTSNQTGWLKGMAVDSLSLYEAGVIAHTLTDFALEAKLVSELEAGKIRSDIEIYFKKELIKVRTAKELNSQECQDTWKQNGFKIYENHIGTKRAKEVASYFEENEVTIMKQESCCSEGEDKCCEKKETGMVEKSTITCPYCGHEKLETMPTDVCQIKYTCEKCKKDINPKTGDCCVYCSYGNHKCPSKQNES